MCDSAASGSRRQTPRLTPSLSDVRRSLIRSTHGSIAESRAMPASRSLALAPAVLMRRNGASLSAANQGAPAVSDTAARAAAATNPRSPSPGGRASHRLRPPSGTRVKVNTDTEATSARNHPSPRRSPTRAPCPAVTRKRRNPRSRGTSADAQHRTLGDDAGDAQTGRGRFRQRANIHDAVAALAKQRWAARCQMPARARSRPQLRTRPHAQPSAALPCAVARTA
jgi:hypothetical protein